MAYVRFNFAIFFSKIFRNIIKFFSRLDLNLYLPYFSLQNGSKWGRIEDWGPFPPTTCVQPWRNQVVGLTHKVLAYRGRSWAMSKYQ